MTPEWSRASRPGRSYEPIGREDLVRLARIARLDREDFFARKTRYRALDERLICVALCQGAALHYVDGKSGVKDFDVWTFYAARPDHPAFPDSIGLAAVNTKSDDQFWPTRVTAMDVQSR